MNNWCICWFFTRRLYKSFGVEGLRRPVACKVQKLSLKPYTRNDFGWYLKILQNRQYAMQLASPSCSWHLLTSSIHLHPNGFPKDKTVQRLCPPHRLVACKSAKTLFVLRTRLLCVSVDLKRFARRMFIQSKTHRTAVHFPQHCRLTL
jgi:hypothetical protein